jgi:hypothetical protein
MSGYFSNLWGTTKARFKLGKGGPQLKANAGTIEARNTADSAYAAVRASLVEVFGNDIVLNAGAAGAGADWSLTVSRSATGQTEDLQVIFPGPSPATGQTLAVASIAAGVITLEWVNTAGGDDVSKVDSTAIAFGSGGTVAMFDLPAGGVISDIEVVVDTPFDGAPSLSIGVTGTLSKFMAATEVDLTEAATTIFHVKPGLPAEGAIQSLIATYAAGGATGGAGRILTHYVPAPG